MLRVLCPLPDRDFDLTEIAVPWRLMREASTEVVFATERGQVAATDPTLLSGVIFGQLGALPEPISYYREMQRDPAFLQPTPWADLDIKSFDGLWLAGGHAPGMRQYLGCARLQEQVAAFWSLARPVA
ncbi:MAG TPA: thiamine biosynthesis protein ThiJ, partial [Nannocystis exedens]|nr:thiamine biosynthesis protein ThiJ [Nannocystis exedens]